MSNSRKEFLVALYTSQSNVPVNEFIIDKLKSINNYQPEYNLQAGDLKFVRARNPDSLNKLITISSVSGTPPFIAASCQRSYAENLYNSFSDFSQYVQGDLVDFSKVNTKEPFFIVGQYLLFLAARFCWKSGVIENIRRISFANKKLQNTILAKGIKNYFPNVEFVQFARNNIKSPKQIGTDVTYIFDEDDERFTGVPQFNEYIPYPKPPPAYEYINDIPVNSFQPLEVVGGDYTYHDPESQITYEDYKAKVVYPDDDPLYDFLCRYVQSLQDNIERISRYYSETAVFSMHIDDSPPESPLQRYARFSRNMVQSLDTDYLCQGLDQINDAYNILFPAGIRNKVTDLRIVPLYKGLFAIAMSGVLTNEYDELLLFEKSMSIGIEGNTVLITNDHLFLHEEK
ncbi:hypothetical protein TVAG_411350 [Trichomonas vaginalis G3]|uniref:Uncharacterized protein n=1 Tax=Trichomonas vaginalis (strain ATCC PRA-98 / G3) TaxID=412133 RepID=A2DXP0_TRIV3|nr:NTF2-like family [Trichomonas vaginalis G3]EAY14869.1 hypothetical protein TVAG_411350 [Trichomonas vaginalis G3]KAI5541150.1 NTF2-like family [Trichomonas vaginalis G3]|eukprot:XP_001327092.1 hypothetical protein [Trichomonas vaginalis G3]